MTNSEINGGKSFQVEKKNDNVLEEFKYIKNKISFFEKVRDFIVSADDIVCETTNNTGTVCKRQ